MAKATPAPKKPLTKTELMANIAAAADVSKKEAAAVLEALAAEIKTSLGSKGAGALTIPGLLKIEKKKVPARGAEGRSEPLQTRRVDGPSGEARLQQGQGAGAEAAQGHGEVVRRGPQLAQRPRGLYHREMPLIALSGVNLGFRGPLVLDHAQLDETKSVRENVRDGSDSATINGRERHIRGTGECRRPQRLSRRLCRGA